jgi:uncharacterized coiled-coil protein SlyX
VNEGLDSEFVSSHADRKLIDNLKNFLDSAYSPAASKANLEFRLAAQAKLIKGSGKSLSKYEKDLDKKIKQREKLGNQIDELTQQIQEQKMLLQQQNLDLNNIGN